MIWKKATMEGWILPPNNASRILRFLSCFMMGFFNTACSSLLARSVPTNCSISCFTASRFPCSCARSMSDLAYRDATLNSDISFCSLPRIELIQLHVLQQIGHQGLLPLFVFKLLLEYLAGNVHRE